MSYTDSPACKMLASHCIVCGKPLVDALSVERGLGPDCYAECRQHIDMDITGGIDEETRKAANQYVYKAAIASQQGRIEDLMRYAQTIEDMGLSGLAGKIRRRFEKAMNRKPDIVILLDGDFYKVKTPFRRGDKEAFIAAWRKIPGRRFVAGQNVIPVVQKNALFALLRDFFGGKYANGPKGMFRIPKPEPKPVQMELAVV